MPRKPIDYSNTIIYKLACKNTDVTDIYVGHTTNFVKRKNQHKKRCNNLNDPKSQYRVYCFIRKHGGFDNWDIVELERVSCKDRIEAAKRERFYLELLKATLNKSIPGRTRTEYTLDTKDNKREYDKQYRLINSERRAMQKREYGLKNRAYCNRKAQIYYMRKKSRKQDEMIDALILSANIHITQSF